MPDLRLLTYNVRSLRDDVEALATVVRGCQPDVVAVQEAPRFARWRSKRAALARRCGLVVATADRDGGLMVMTSLAARVLATRFVLLPRTEGLHQRAVVSADLALRGARWTVASVHFSLDGAERLAHLDRLWPALDEAPHPLAVAGDLNEEPGGPVWSALASRYTDAFDAAGSGPTGFTFPAARPARRIDGVFADRNLEVLECRVVTDAPMAARASDHLPLLAVLRQQPLT